MELKLEVQLSGNPLTFSSMYLGCVSFLLLCLAFGKGYCLLNPPSIFLSEKNISISDGENEGKEGKWLTQHLTASSAVFKALRMGFLWVVEGEDQHFSTSSVGRLGAHQLYHLRPRSWEVVLKNQKKVCCSADMLSPCCWGKLAAACASAWRTLLQAAVGAPALAWAAACSSSGSLSGSRAVWHCQTPMLQKWRQDVTSAQLYMLSLRL